MSKVEKGKMVIVDCLGILLGVVLTAIALDIFLIPNKIAAGGVSGLATVVYHLFHIPVGLTMLLLNVPLFLASVKYLGMSFGFKTIIGAISLSFFVDLLSPYLPVITQDALLASIYGGALSGVGMGITFRFGGSTGGTDLAARLVNHLFGTSVGQALLINDFVVIALAGVFFNAELALYALICLFVTSKVIDLIQEGLDYAKAAFIISDKIDEIADAVLNGLQRGATSLKGEGMYTRKERNILLCIVTRSELVKLKSIVKEIDPKAFVMIAEVHEVLGEGFKSY